MESLRLEDTAASDPDAAQVFLFSSHPRVVDTIGPVSPAGPTVVRQVRSLKYSWIRIFNRLQFQDANKDESEKHEITQELPDIDKQSVYLSDVTICLGSLQTTLDIIHPSSLSDYYDFALEEKVLGLG